MKAEIKFSIECGEKTCAVEKGKFCKFLILSMNGKDNCFLFGRVFDGNGWVQRHKDCLKMAKNEGMDIIYPRPESERK